MPTSPTPIDALPPTPNPDDAAGFDSAAYNWSAALPTFRTQTNDAATNVYNNAVEAEESATAANSSATAANASATAAQAVVNAAMFDPATAYTQGQAAISAVNLLTYRRKSAGTSATDPSADPANWAPLGNPLGLRNRLINATFEVNQRAVTSPVTLAAGQYGHDCWKAGAGGCTYSWSRVNGLTTITITAGSLVQVIEGSALDDGAANTYVLGWSGTSTGKIGAGASSGSGVTGSAAGGTNLTIEFGTGTLARPQLEPGSFPTTFERRPPGLELALCQRYYAKSYLPAVAPGTIGSDGAVGVGISVAAGTYVVLASIHFPVEMRAAPTVTYYSHGTGAAGKIWDQSGSVDVACISYGSSCRSSSVTNSGAIGASGRNILVHWTAEAEL